jgi:hypothetical protein
MEFDLDFNQSGTHYLWVRAAASGPGDDSFWVQLDDGPWSKWDVLYPSANPNGYPLYMLSGYWWNDEGYDGSGYKKMQVNVPSAGEHTLRIQMRSDGLKIDRILLATASYPSYKPQDYNSGDGPAESLLTNGSGGSLAPTLAGSPNRLVEITDGAGTVWDWDAGAGTFGYDVAGRMTSAPAPYNITSVSYDERGLPVTGTGSGQSARYRYTADGERYYKQVGSGPPVHYVLDGNATLGVVEGVRLRYWNIVLPSGEVVGRIDVAP